MPTDRELLRLQRLVKADALEPAPAHAGITLERVDLLKIAEAIEAEVAVARLMAWSKVSLHMDLDDALQFAARLKQVRR